MKHYPKNIIYQLVIVWVVLLSYTLAPESLTAQMDEAEIGSLNSQASTFFSQANSLLKTDSVKAYELYDKAIVRYLKMIDDGNIENVYLYYNIANAYLMKHDLGRAILNYRRAEMLDPTYTNLIKNLAYARLQRKDHIPASTEKKILHTLFFWHYDLGQKVKFILITLLWVCLCLTVTLKLWAQELRFVRLLFIVFMAGFVAFSVSLIVDTVQTHRDIQGVILAESVVTYQGDSENYPPSFEQPLHAGTEFKVIEDRSQWLHIELANGLNTWIRRTHVELIMS